MLGLTSSLQLTDRVGDQHYVVQLDYIKESQILIAALSIGGFKCVHLGYGSVDCCLGTKKKAKQNNV
jgi:hypothetical protein